MNEEKYILIYLLQIIGILLFYFLDVTVLLGHSIGSSNISIQIEWMK